jgi:hypothetical protein
VLTAVVLACATATAAMGGAPADRTQAATAATGPDRDRDGLNDDLEVRRYHTDPRRRDTDHDGLRDGPEVFRYKTNPLSGDTDRDGLDDGAEVGRYRTDPRRRDTDRDFLFDGDELRRYKTNPRVKDTDGDGWGDGIEIKRGTEPLNPRSRPGFPREDNAGVPRDKALTPYTGPSNITTPNTVIDGKTMGCIGVSAPGVVIRNSRVVCTGSALHIDDAKLYGQTPPLLIEDSTISCSYAPGATGIAEAHFIARRVEITQCENGLSIDQNVTIEDSYIHDLDFKNPEAHTDGIQLSFGHWNGSSYPCCAVNVTIRHNTILGGDDSGLFATSAIISNKLGPDENVLIENNLLAGGAYALYCDQGLKGTNYRVLNNRFSTRFSPKVGFYGPTTDCADETNSGNVIFETGRPFTLG